MGARYARACSPRRNASAGPLAAAVKRSSADLVSTCGNASTIGSDTPDTHPRMVPACLRGDVRGTDVIYGQLQYWPNCSRGLHSTHKGALAVIKVIKLAHVGLNAVDLSRQAEFYNDRWGLERIDEFRGEMF